MFFNRAKDKSEICLGVLFRGVLVAALGATVVGCDHPEVVNPNRAVELRLFDRITTIRGAEYSRWLVASFNSRHRGRIHVTWSGTEDEMFKPKVNVVLRSPSAPDIFFTWEGGWAKYMVDSGYAEPLDRYYEKYGWDHRLNRAGTFLTSLESHRYFVPTKMAASIVWYRPDIFKRYGASVPRSWSEMLVVARQLKSDGVIPLLIANQKRWPAQFMWSALFVNKYGVSTYNRLLSHKIPWTDPRVVDIFSLMKSLSDQGFFEEGSNALDVTPAATLFASGRAAMWYQGSFLLTRFTDDKGSPLFPFDFFEFPRVSSEPPTVSIFVEDGLMINRHSTHKDEAAVFLDWAISTEAQQEQLAFGLPFPSDVNVDLKSVSPVSEKLGRLIASKSTTTFMHPDHALVPALSNPFLDFLQAVLAGAMSPQQAAKQTEELAETAEDTYWWAPNERGFRPLELEVSEESRQ